MTNISGVLLALVPLVIIAGALVGYFYYYRRRINQHLNDDYHRESSTITPLNLGIILLSVFIIIRSTGNRAEIRNLQQQVSNLNNSIRQLQSEIAEMSNSDGYPYGLSIYARNIDRQDDKYYVLLDIEVVPERGMADDQITLFLGQKEIPLTLEGNSYKATFSMETAAPYPECSLLVESGGRQYRTPIYLEGEKLLPEDYPFVNIYGSIDDSSGKMKVNLNLEMMDETIPQERKLTSLKMIVTDGEKEIDSVDLSDQIGTLENNELIVINKSYSVSKDGVHQVYFRATDAQGNQYVYNKMTATEGGYYRITDKDGILIFEF